MRHRNRNIRKRDFGIHAHFCASHSWNEQAVGRLGSSDARARGPPSTLLVVPKAQFNLLCFLLRFDTRLSFLRLRSCCFLLPVRPRPGARYLLFIVRLVLVRIPTDDFPSLPLPATSYATKFFLRGCYFLVTRTRTLALSLRPLFDLGFARLSLLLLNSSSVPTSGPGRFPLRPLPLAHPQPRHSQTGPYHAAGSWQARLGPSGFSGAWPRRRARNGGRVLS